MDLITTKYSLIDTINSCIACAQDEDRINKDKLLDLRNALNKLFPDFICENITYTRNTDNEFFGIFISPKYNFQLSRLINPSLEDPISEMKPVRYFLELDSKLFTMNLTHLEIASLLINDINKYNSIEPLEYVKNAIDSVCAYNNTSIMISRDDKSLRLLEYTILHTIRNHVSFSSSCHIKDKIASGILIDLKLNEYYESAMDKVRKNIASLLKTELECETTLMLNWFCMFKPYTSKDNRYTVEMLKTAMRCTGSRLERKEILNAIDGLQILDSRSFIDQEILTEAFNKKKRSLFDKIKMNGLKSIEEDVYEYKMRLKNVETENDAIFLMRQINSRMAMIDDYLMTEEDLSENERDRWYKLYEKYETLREELSKKNVYNRKMYGLFVDYNALQQMNSDNYMTMNTYY